MGGKPRTRADPDEVISLHLDPLLCWPPDETLETKLLKEAREMMSEMRDAYMAKQYEVQELLGRAQEHAGPDRWYPRQMSMCITCRTPQTTMVYLSHGFKTWPVALDCKCHEDKNQELLARQAKRYQR